MMTRLEEGARPRCMARTWLEVFPLRAGANAWQELTHSQVFLALTFTLAANYSADTAAKRSRSRCSRRQRKNIMAASTVVDMPHRMKVPGSGTAATVSTPDMPYILFSELGPPPNAAVQPERFRSDDPLCTSRTVPNGAELFPKIFVPVHTGISEVESVTPTRWESVKKLAAMDIKTPVDLYTFV